MNSEAGIPKETEYRTAEEWKLIIPVEMVGCSKKMSELQQFWNDWGEVWTEEMEKLLMKTLVQNRQQIVKKYNKLLAF